MRRSLALAVSLLVVGCVDDPRDPNTWIKKLNDPREGKDAVRELVKIKDKAAVPPLIDLYKKGKDAEVLRAISTFKDPRAVPIMIDALDYSEDSFDAAAIAANALGDTPDPSAVEPLMATLKKPLPIKTRANIVKLEAMKALGKIGDKRAVDALDKVLSTSADDQDFFLNKTAAGQLARFNDPKSVPFLIRGLFMTGRGADIFAECRTALVGIGEPAVQPLVDAMNRKNAELEADAKKYEFIPGIIVQKTAILLGDIRSKTAVPALLAELKKPDDGLKKGVSGHQSVIIALGLIGSPDVKAPLLAILTDAKQPNKLRAAAAEALNGAGDTSALPALLKIANESFINMKSHEIDAEHGALVAAAATAYSRLAWAEQANVTWQKLPADLEESDAHVVFKNASARLEVAKACKKDVACYAKMLDDKDSAKAEKAALMLGRLGKPGVDELAKAVGVSDLSVRMTVLVGLAQAGKASPEVRAALAKQIELDDGKPMIKKAGVVDEMRVVLAQISRG
ncbi:MAG TPA: HEAT repeat domain-containing protein [Polyangia bacterium]|nr:HEAT repeat domain-containing protein [Polyangia bacterium]